METCLALLRSTRVGRIGFVVDQFPVILPVNFRFVQIGPAPWLALRTRPGGVIDRADMHVALEIDGIDTANQQGRSVLVSGKLNYLGAPPEDRSLFDSEP